MKKIFIILGIVIVLTSCHTKEKENLVYMYNNNNIKLVQLYKNYHDVGLEIHDCKRCYNLTKLEQLYNKQTDIDKQIFACWSLSTDYISELQKLGYTHRQFMKLEKTKSKLMVETAYNLYYKNAVSY